EHQVELARRGERAHFLRVRAERRAEVAYRRQRHERPVPVKVVAILGAQVEELERLLLRLLFARLAPFGDSDEDALPLGLDPPAIDLIVAIAFLRLAAIDHEVMEKI